MRDFRAAVLGVIFPLRGVGAAGSRAGDRARMKASRRVEGAGELGADPTSRGVSGLLVFARKLELRAGVMGLPLDCLSMGILERGEYRVTGRLGSSSMARRDA
jgi:hypothetical protein